MQRLLVIYVCYIVRGNPPVQWLEMDFGVARCVTGSAIKARPTFSQWVTSYNLQYWSGSTWINIPNVQVH